MTVNFELIELDCENCMKYKFPGKNSFPFLEFGVIKSRKVEGESWIVCPRCRVFGSVDPETATLKALPGRPRIDVPHIDALYYPVVWLKDMTNPFLKEFDL